MEELSSSVVARVASKWYSLGIELGLTTDFLDAVEQNYPRDSLRCCTKVFQQWLLQPEPDRSWDKLIQALNSSSIAQSNLAQELSEKYSFAS